MQHHRGMGREGSGVIDEKIPTNPSPWHKGEIELQTLTGVDELMKAVGQRSVRPFLIDQHRQFYPLLPFIVLGTVDREGQPWATLRAGRPGFVASPDDTHLDILIRRDLLDPAEGGLSEGASVGLLGIELPTRRRNRMNGNIEQYSEDHLVVRVEHSFGNCRKFINQRTPVFVRDPDQTVAAEEQVADLLDADAQAWIRDADMFFVATYADTNGAGRQVDVSHRGGDKGFVSVDDERSLTIPDYAGNSFFNTLGNILVNPRAGLVFPDFRSGDLLQLTGKATVILQNDRLADFAGARRLWQFKVEKVVRRQDVLPLRFSIPAHTD